MRNALLMCFVFSFALSAAEEAEDLFQKGLEAMRKSEVDQEAVVVAAKLLTKAAALYEKEGDEAKLVEINSFLYWCKKKLTLKGAEEFKKTGTEVLAKLEKVVEKAPPSEAQVYYDRAEAFAKSRPTDYLLIAIRFFEVADRFKGTDISLQAQDKSLNAQQKAADARPVAVKGPAPVGAKPKSGKWTIADAVGTYNGGHELGKYIVTFENGKFALLEEKTKKSTKNSLFLDANTIVFEWSYEGSPQVIIGTFKADSAEISCYRGQKEFKAVRPKGASCWTTQAPKE